MEIKNNVAYIIQKICAITGDKPGKTAVQRTVYLIQTEALDLGFKYKPHCYGVYSEALNSEIDLLIANNIVRAERKGNSFLMDVDSFCAVQSDMGKEAKKILSV